MVTIKDIAKRAGVSVATVSYVLNDSRYVSPERKERVVKAIEELNYIPNAVARGLRVRHSMTIGLTVSDITNPFYPDLAKACEEMAQSEGYTVIMINTNDQQNLTRAATAKLHEGKIDGLIVASALSHDVQALQEVIDAGYPVVLAHRVVEGLKVDTVVVDNFSGSYQAIRHLASLGHDRIAMVMGVIGSSVSQERVRGFQQAMQDLKLPILPGYLLNGLSKYNVSYTATIQLLKRNRVDRPTAIFAGSDMAAMGVMDAAQDMGLQVPADLAIVGFDDLFISSMRPIQLTSIRVPRYQIGHQATRLLLDQIERNTATKPVEIVLPTSLVIRKTCGSEVYPVQSY